MMSVIERQSQTLKKAIHLIDKINEKTGRFVSWFLLLMVGITFINVLLRYFFGFGRVWLQELVVYLHAACFLLGSAYALKVGAHVRVDIFYRTMSETKKAYVDLIGVVFLLLPTVATVWVSSFPYVADSWSVFEGSKDGGGLEAVFLLKSTLLLFSFLLFLQAISQGAKACLVLIESRGGRG